MATFTLDLYKDWTNEQLKTRCRQLVRAVGDYELIIAIMASSEEALRLLSEDQRETAINRRKAYED